MNTYLSQKGEKTTLSWSKDQNNKSQKRTREGAGSKTHFVIVAGSEILTHQYNLKWIYFRENTPNSPSLLSHLLCLHLLSFSVGCWGGAAETKWLLQEKTCSSESRHKSSRCPVYAEYQIKEQRNKNGWSKSKCLPQSVIVAVEMLGWHQVSPKTEQMSG